MVPKSVRLLHALEAAQLNLGCSGTVPWQLSWRLKDERTRGLTRAEDDASPDVVVAGCRQGRDGLLARAWTSSYLACMRRRFRRQPSFAPHLARLNPTTSPWPLRNHLAAVSILRESPAVIIESLTNCRL